MRMRISSQLGFTLLEIMIVVALIGLLAAIAIPTSVRARTTSQTNTCIHNLQEIEWATQVWALENNEAPNATVTFNDISSYLKHQVVCPAGGSTATFNSSYDLHGVINPPTCLVLPDDHVLPVETGS